jgi:hypothetical protein
VIRRFIMRKVVSLLVDFALAITLIAAVVLIGWLAWKAFFFFLHLIAAVVVAAVCTALLVAVTIFFVSRLFQFVLPEEDK